MRERRAVGPEGEAEALQRGREGAVGVAARAAKRHVLDEVREAELVVALVQRADGHEQPERNAILRLGVGENRVAKAIGQRALAQRRIAREIRVDGWPRRGEGDGGAEQPELKRETEPAGHGATIFAAGDTVTRKRRRRRARPPGRRGGGTYFFGGWGRRMRTVAASGRNVLAAWLTSAIVTSS